MKGKEYRFYSYFDLIKNEGLISVGSRALIRKLKISKTTLYNRVKDDGWYIDDACVIFFVDPADVLRAGVKNKNIEEYNKKKKESELLTNGSVQVHSTPKPKPKGKKKSHIRTVESTISTPDNLGGDKGEDGLPNGTLEKSTPPSPPVDETTDQKIKRLAEEGVKKRQEEERVKKEKELKEKINTDLLV